MQFKEVGTNRFECEIGKFRFVIYKSFMGFFFMDAFLEESELHSDCFESEMGTTAEEAIANAKSVIEKAVDEYVNEFSELKLSLN